MRKFELTPDQHQVVFATDRRFTVRASAGAGKTGVLVERYLWHVETEGLSPDQILTITFTRKAAAEMKGRIVRRLREAGRESDAQVAETGPIQTIHGFCERVLRENALSAGIDPKFDVLADGAQVRQVFDIAVRNALAEMGDQSDEVRTLLLVLAGSRVRYAPDTLLGRVSYEVDRVLGKLRGSGLDLDTLAEIYRSEEAFRSRLNLELSQGIPADVAGIPGSEPADLFIPALALRLREHELKRPSWMRPATAEAESAAVTHALGLGQLALATWAELSAEMSRLQAFDFAELESRAVDLVTKHPEARRRLQRQYKAVMVDEAQDVNPMQYALLDGLGLETEMMVGDPQQSIYAFRQADRELFIGRTGSGVSRPLRKNHRSVDGILRFVDRLFGQLWGEDYMPLREFQATEDPFGEDDGDFAGVELWPQDARDAPLTASWIQELLSEGEFQPKEVAVLVRSAQAAIDLSTHLEKLGIEFQIVGGAENFYTRMEVRDLANALQALADPYDDFALLALLRSPMVGLSLDSIVVLAKNKPVAETLGLVGPKPEDAQEVVLPLDTDQEILDQFIGWFVPLSRYADRLPAWELLAEILKVTPYFERLAERPNGRQTIANVRKLLDLAAREPELGAVPYAEQIREIQRVRHKEGDAPAVDDDANVLTLMTIHKAKGLEFKCVILPELHREPSTKGAPVLIDPISGLIAARFGAEQPVFHRRLNEIRREAEIEEELRVLYVAMTRARERLCLCVGEGAKPSTHASMIAKRFSHREAPPPGIRVRLRRGA